MTEQNGRPFNEWLRAQLKAKKMSQRQLAQASGVDHSTISRLVRGDRTPSLGTATKLARGLRELRDDADAPQYLALRADEALAEPQVRQVMEYYLAVRMRRFARPIVPVPSRSASLPERPQGRHAPLASVVGLPPERRITSVRPASIVGRRPPGRA
jgi:transcriptional regulator with XRE-family HTH domain